MDNEDKEAESNPSSLNVSSMDVQLLETSAEDMLKVNVDNACAGEGEEACPLESKETEYEDVSEIVKHSPDEAFALEPSLADQYEDYQLIPAQAKSQQEGLNQGDEASMDNAEQEEGLTEGEGALFQVEQERDLGLNEGDSVCDGSPGETIEKEEELAEGKAPVVNDQADSFNVEQGIAANDASMNSIQHLDEVEGLAERGASSQNDEEQVAEMRQGQSGASDACVDTTEEKDSDQTEHEPLVGLNNSAVDASLEETSAEGEAPVDIGKEPADVGLSEGECDAHDVAEDIIQGEAPVQVQQEPDVGLNEDDYAAKGALMNTIQDEAPVQIEQDQDVGLNEGKCAADDALMVTAQQKDRVEKDELPVQIEQDPSVASNEGECAADDSPLNAMCKVEVEDEAPVQSEPDPDAEVPAENCQVTDEETAEGQRSELDRANESSETALGRIESGVDSAEMLDTSNRSDSPTDYFEHVPSNIPTASEITDSTCGNEGVTISEEAPQEEPSDGASYLAEESQEQPVGDAAVLPVEHENLRGGDSQGCETLAGAADNIEQDVQEDYCELPVLKELIEQADHQSPSVITQNEPPIVPGAGESSLMKEPSLCTPAIEALIAGDEPLDDYDTHEDEESAGKYDSSKQLETEQPNVKEQVIVDSPTEGKLHEESSLADEEEAMEKTMGTVDEAEEAPLGTLSLVENMNVQKHGLEDLVSEQREDEVNIAAPSSVVKDDDVCNSEEEVITNNGQNGAEEAMNSISSIEVKNGDLHKCDVYGGEPVWECRKMSNGGSNKPKVINSTASTPNGLSKLDELSNINKQNVAPAEFNMSDGLGTQSEEAILKRGLNAGEWEEMMGVHAIVGEAASMDEAVPLSSMVQENGFLHHSEENLVGQQYPTPVKVLVATEDEKARVTNGWSPVVPQQKLGKDSAVVEQRDANCNGNTTIVRRTTWWGCCGMLDLLLHKD